MSEDFMNMHISDTEIGTDRVTQEANELIEHIRQKLSGTSAASTLIAFSYVIAQIHMGTEHAPDPEKTLDDMKSIVREIMRRGKDDRRKSFN